MLLVGVLAGGSAYAQATAGHGTSTIYAQDATPQFGWGYGNSTYNPMTIGSVNNTATVTGSYITTTGTGNNTTSLIHYYSPVMLLTNVTVNDLNLHGANKFVEQVKQGSNITATLGYGNYVSNGSFSFTPLETANATGNATSFVNLTFALNPGMLTENASADIMVKIAFANASTSFEVHAFAVGDKNAQPWYSVGMDGSYLILGVGMIATLLGSAMYIDMDMGVITSSAKKTAQRLTGKHRRRK